MMQQSDFDTWMWYSQELIKYHKNKGNNSADIALPYDSEIINAVSSELREQGYEVGYKPLTPIIVVSWQSDGLNSKSK